MSGIWCQIDNIGQFFDALASLSELDEAYPVGPLASLPKDADEDDTLLFLERPAVEESPIDDA